MTDEIPGLDADFEDTLEPDNVLIFPMVCNCLLSCLRTIPVSIALRHPCFHGSGVAVIPNFFSHFSHTIIIRYLNFYRTENEIERYTRAIKTSSLIRTFQNDNAIRRVVLFIYIYIYVRPSGLDYNVQNTTNAMYN